MTVTDIKEYVKGKYEIYLNDEFAFILYKSEIKEKKLAKGCQLSDEQYGDIVDNILTKRAAKRAMNLLMKTDRTEADLRRKLKENRYPETAIDRAVDYVKSFHYIDDNRYAYSYISAKAEALSKSVIRQKLIEKGIPKSIIEEEMENFYTDDDAPSELELIRKQMLKICPKPQELEYNERQKLFAKLYRKGFSIGDIERVYDSL